MTGDRGNRTQGSGRDSRLGAFAQSRENVQDVFDRGEAERDKDGIDYAVKKAVEVFVFACHEEKNKPFEALFDKGGDDKSV